jgi:tetratricopeptide (TPR) repeat protein
MHELSGESVPRALVLKKAGYLHYSACNLDLALQCLSEALALLREAEDRENVVDALYTMASVYRSKTDFSEAVACLLDALRVSKQREPLLDSSHLLSELSYLRSQMDEGEFLAACRRGTGTTADADLLPEWLNGLRGSG